MQFCVWVVQEFDFEVMFFFKFFVVFGGIMGDIDDLDVEFFKFFNEFVEFFCFCGVVGSVVFWVEVENCLFFEDEVFQGFFFIVFIEYFYFQIVYGYYWISQVFLIFKFFF